jgi:hypothetical protein
MKEDRIVPPILHYTIVDEVADYLPEEVRNHITNSIIIRENMRYKGPNRSLQTAGILAETIPYLTKALVKAETEREKLLEQNSTLEKKYSDSIKKIKERDKEINELEIENQKNKENTYKLTGSYTQYILGRKKEKKVYEKIIKDLSLVLVLKKQEKAEKLVKHIINRYSKEISRSEEYFRNAEKEFSM